MDRYSPIFTYRRLFSIDSVRRSRGVGHPERAGSNLSSEPTFAFPCHTNGRLYSRSPFTSTTGRASVWGVLISILLEIRFCAQAQNMGTPREGARWRHPTPALQSCVLLKRQGSVPIVRTHYSININWFFLHKRKKYESPHAAAHLCFLRDVSLWHHPSDHVNMPRRTALSHERSQHIRSSSRQC